MKQEFEVFYTVSFIGKVESDDDINLARDIFLNDLEQKLENGEHVEFNYITFEDLEIIEETK